MKTKQQINRKKGVHSTLCLIAFFFLNQGFAQYNSGMQMANSGLAGYFEKLYNQEAFVKEVFPGGGSGSSEMIFPASEGYGRMLEEEAVYLQYFVKKFEEAASPVYEVSVRNVNEKNYVKWMVKNDAKDGIFVIECAEDNMNFSPVGFKNRVGSDISAGLLYSWVDDKPHNGEVWYYRITAIGEDGTYNFSRIVQVTNPKYTRPRYF